MRDSSKAPQMLARLPRMRRGDRWLAPAKVSTTFGISRQFQQPKPRLASHGDPTARVTPV